MRENSFVAIGTPIIDLIKEVNEDVLLKYQLKANDAIAISEKNEKIFAELEELGVKMTCGCSSFNTARAVQFSLKLPKIGCLFGLIGQDRYATIIKKQLNDEQINYVFETGERTGVSAILLTNNNRSIVTDLRDSKLYSIKHLQRKETWEKLTQGNCFYLPAFFLQISMECILTIADYCHQQNRIFAFNLSAPFLSKKFPKEMALVVSYVDLLFANDEELMEFAQWNECKGKTIPETLLNINKMPRKNPEKKRIIVVTRGADSVIVAEENQIFNFPIPKMNADEIKDTTGAGDAFAGGFIAYHLLGKPLTECVQQGCKIAQQVLKNYGCNF